MKNILTAIICSAIFATAPAFAGASHGHSHGAITKEQATQKAEQRLNKLVKDDKIVKSWNNKKATRVEQKTYSGQQEWVVTFNNPTLSDKSKQKLYMFFQLDGHYLATNFTGK